MLLAVASAIRINDAPDKSVDLPIESDKGMDLTKPALLEMEIPVSTLDFEDDNGKLASLNILERDMGEEKFYYQQF